MPHSEDSASTEDPAYIRSLGNRIIAVSQSNPTAEDVADGIVAVVCRYHDEYENEREALLTALQEDDYEYDELSDALIRELLLETGVAYFAREIAEYVCDELDEDFTVEEVYNHIPDKYIEAETQF